MHRITLALVAAIALLGCKKTLDNDKLVSSIKDGLAAKGLKVKSVDCPHHDAKKDDNFPCNLVTEDGQKVVVDITQTDNDGNVKWLARGSIFTVSEVQKTLSEKNGSPVTLTCAHPVFMVQDKETVTCDVASGAEKHKIDITIEGDGYTWKMH